MLTITADLEILDENKLTEVLRDEINIAMRSAVKAFIVATLERIPIWTGFLWGSYTNYVNAFSISPGSAPSEAQRPPRPIEIYYHYDGSRIVKTPFGGIQFVTPIGQSVTVNENGATFTIDQKIDYYDINDVKLGWHSLEAGAKAFEKELKKAVERMDLSRVWTVVHI